MIQQSIDGPSKEQLLEIAKTERRVERWEIVQALHAEGVEMTVLDTISIETLLRESQRVDSEIESLQAEKTEIAESVIFHNDRRKAMLSDEKLVDFNRRGLRDSEGPHDLHHILVEFDKETNNMLRDICHL